MRTRTPPGSFLFVSGFILICKSLDAPPPERPHSYQPPRFSAPRYFYRIFESSITFSIS